MPPVPHTALQKRPHFEHVFKLSTEMHIWSSESTLVEPREVFDAPKRPDYMLRAVARAVKASLQQSSGAKPGAVLLNHCSPPRSSDMMKTFVLC
jgi:hypothetical protein